MSALAHHPPRQQVEVGMMGRPLASLAVVAVAATLQVATATQTSPTALRDRLAAAKALDCTFSVLTTGGWDGGVPNATVGSASRSVSFHDINTQEGTATAGSGFGDSFIVVRLAGEYLHFLQMSSSGPVYMTTVLAREGRDGRLLAIQSRHEFTTVIVPGFTSRPEQYLGDCTVGE
jgi:hypothetical protein